jgi:hypothetical protein
MPRQPRLDAPDGLHHVRVRGLQRAAIFRDDTDRADCVACLVEQEAFSVQARGSPPDRGWGSGFVQAASGRTSALIRRRMASWARSRS